VCRAAARTDDTIMNDEHFLQTDEVGAYLQVHQRTLYRLIRNGQIPAVRVGRQWRFRRQDLDAWLNSGRQMGKRTRVVRGRPRVLVVDDEEAVRQIVAKTLSADYDVETATDGRTALNMLQSGGYDLLMTDLKMPGMDGLTVIREARSQMSDLPIVILTAFSTEASAIEAINLGVSGYLLKPFRVPRILAVTARALGTA
jgi:excisionase family DNA binding protein